MEKFKKFFALVFGLPHWLVKNAWPELILFPIAIPISLTSGLGSKQMLVITALLVFQNASFTIVSRARQSNNLKLHAIAAIGSNGFFVFVIATVAAHYNDVPLKLWYIVCTVVGSVHAHWISLHKIEQMKQFKKDSLPTRADLDVVRSEARTGLEEHGLRLDVLETKAEDQERTTRFVLTNLAAIPKKKIPRISFGRRARRSTLRQMGQKEFSFENSF
ncbi:MAG: hypothetical protein ACM3KM_03895 [Acidobacteriaceae bacterium]